MSRRKRDKNSRNKKNKIRNNNRYLSREERNKIQRKRKKYTRVNYKKFSIFIFLFIIFVIALIYGIGKLFGIANKKEKPTKKVDKIESVDEKNIESKDKDIDTANLIESMNEDLSKKYLNLEKQIAGYINENELNKDNIKIGYSEINNNHIFKFTNGQNIFMKNSDLFIISMIAEDLSKEGLLNLNKEITLDIEEKDKTSDEVENNTEEKKSDRLFTLRNLIQEMIINPRNEIVEKVLEEVEFKASSEWKTYANKKYGINIKTKNDMSLEDLISILKRLVSKKDNTYLYEDTINILVKSAKSNNDIYYLENENFMGFVGEYKYGYTMDIGFIFGENPYIYIIQTDYSDKKINRDLRNILYNLNKSYR